MHKNSPNAAGSPNNGDVTTFLYSITRSPTAQGRQVAAANLKFSTVLMETVVF